MRKPQNAPFRFAHHRVAFGHRCIAGIVLWTCAIGELATAQEGATTDSSIHVHVEYLAQNRLAVVRAARTRLNHLAWGIDPSAIESRSAQVKQLSFDKFPFRIETLEQQLRISRTAGDFRIQVMTFQRSDEREDYGVYALQGEKQELLIDHPLSGTPINWPSRTAQEAVVHLLTLNGLDSDVATKAVRENWEDWGGHGLRILLVLPGEHASWFPGVQLKKATQVMLVSLEWVDLE